jgi:hypothetical protein
MRSYKNCFDYLEENLIQRLNPDIFIHTWSNQGSVSRKEEPYTNDPHDYTVNQSEIKKLYRAEKVVVEEFEESFYKRIDNISVPDDIEQHESYTKSILPLFYKMYKCNELKKKKENEGDFRYDVVIITRPDIAVLNPLPQKVLNNPQFLWELRDDNTRGSHVVDDLYVASSSKNIDYYTSIFNRLNKYWQKVTKKEYSKEIPYFTRAQRLLRHHINKSNIEIRRTDNYGHQSDWILVRYGMDISFYEKSDLQKILHILKNGDTGIAHTSNKLQDWLLILREVGSKKYL